MGRRIEQKNKREGRRKRKGRKKKVYKWFNDPLCVIGSKRTKTIKNVKEKGKFKVNTS